MLQQTRVSTVIGYFERWMAAFPDLASLARGLEDDVLKAWEGLGYYSRARNLHRAAKIVLAERNGEIPGDPEELARLPGVGTYTAAAVASIAYGRDAAVVDGNVRRVLARLVALPSDPTRPPAARALDALARRLLPPGTAALHNQAMMELGALVCTPKSPDCPRCPFGAACRARERGDPESYPVRAARRAVPHYDVAVGIVSHKGKVFIDRRPEGKLLGGLWEFPGGKKRPGETVRRALARELREEFGLKVRVEKALPPVNHAYTHFRVTLHPFLCAFESMDPPPGAQPWRWVGPEELACRAMPRGNRKILETLEKELHEGGTP
jgi:A/G-specific adenine glycosylase